MPLHSPPNASRSLERAFERARDEVVPLLQGMLAHNTEIGEPDDPPRDDRAHQEHVAGYLRELGAEVELFEPAVEEVRHHPMYRPGQTFEGRPVLWARVPGSGRGRSLLFNGHYDVVLAAPLADWSRDPWGGELADGRVYGRGSCDMKGGIAAALAAVHGLVAEGLVPGGDVFFNVVPFEEVNGMGTTATALRSHRADGAICCEPTELHPLVADRGLLAMELTVQGRSAHGEIPQPHHSQGGGVNAIEKLTDLILHMRRLTEQWQARPDKQHALLSRPSALVGKVEGGAFWATFPATATATYDITYLPANADDDGYGSEVKAEIEAHLACAAALDDWLREHPPRVRWLADYPPIELAADHPLARTALGAARRHGPPDRRIGGFDSWADQVMLIKEAGIPCVLLGPGSILQAHTADEYVPVADLEAAVRIYIDAAHTWCGPEQGGTDGSR